jgi:hypothetical protein
MAKLLSGTRIYGSATVDTQLFISGTNLSTSTTTGALQVIGGVGVGGGIYVSGVITATNTTNASSTVTGALQVTGGVGIGGNLWVGGTIFGAHTGVSTTATNLSGSLPGAIPIQSANGVTAYIATGTTGYVLTWSGSTATWSAVSGLSAGSATTATHIAGGTAGQLHYQTAPGVTSFVSTSTAGNVLVSNGTSVPTYNNTLTLTATSASISTTTGALVVAGGVGIGGNLTLGGVLNTFNKNTEGIRIATTFSAGGNGTGEYGSLGFYGNLLGANDNKTAEIRSYNDGVFYGSLEFFVRTNGATAVGTDTTRLIKIGGQTNNVIVYSTVSSTSTTTGALQVVGGVGIGGDLYVGGNLYQVGGTYATLATTYNLINTTATTVNFAGAATTINMGASNSGTTNVRNNLVISGNLTVQGTTTIVDSTVTNIADPIITLGGPANNAAPTADDNKDRGIAFKYLNNAASTSTGFFGYKDSTGYFTYIATATITNEVVSGTKGALDVNLAGGSAMALVYQTGTDSTAFLAAGTSGYILQTNGTGSVPTWVAPGAISVTTSSQLQTVLQTANATYYPTFVDSNNAVSTAELFYTTASFVINPSTGNVGIGTASPAAKLHVVGSESRFGGVASGYISVYNASTRSGYLQANGGTDFRIGADTDPMTLYVAGSERVRIDSSGTVGIGEVSPVTYATTGSLVITNTTYRPELALRTSASTGSTTAIKLGVTSSIPQGGAVISTYISAVSGQPTDLIFNLVTSGTLTERLRITSNGGIAFSGSTNYGTAGYHLQSNGDAAPTWVPVSSTTVGTSTQVQTVLQTANATYYPTFVDSNNAVSTAELVYTTSSFNINPMTGNVGIAAAPSSTATYRLNVANIIQVGAQGGADVTLIGGGAGTGSFIRGYYGTDGTQAFNIVGNGSSYVNASSAGGTFSVGTSTVSTNGLLQVNGGIGIAPNNTVRQTTNADGGTLKFYGTQFVAASSNSGSYGYAGSGQIASVSPSAGAVMLDVGGQGTGTGHRLKVINDGTGLTGYLYYGQEGGSTATIYANASNGYVGISTTSPGAKLDIQAGDGGDTRSIQSVLPASSIYNPATANTYAKVVSGIKFNWYSDNWQLGAARSGGVPVDGFVISRNTTTVMVLTYNGGLSFNGPTNYGTSGQILQSNGDAAPTWVPVSGTTVGTSTQVQTVLQTANATYYPTFVDSNNASATAETVYTTSSFNINARTGAIYAGAVSNRIDSRINIDKEIYYSMQRNIEEGSGTGMTFIGGTLPTVTTSTSTSIPFGKVLSISSYYEAFTEENIPVQPGEILYGEIWAFRANGATGTAGAFYAGVQQLDSNKNYIATNSALNYFIASGVTIPTTGVWTKYSGTITIPLSHPVFSGSDGGPVRYVRPYLIANYPSGTIPTQIVGMIIRRQNLYRDSGHATFNGGFVGVGTNAPKTKIQSSGAAQTTSPTLGSATGAGLYITNTDEAYGLIAGVASSGNAWIQAQRTDAVATAYNLNLQPSGGFVGIGTTSPAGKLEVVGGRSFFGPASETYAVGVRYVSTGGAFYFGASDATATPDGVFSQAGGSERMRISNAGNVGIGYTTTQSGALLAVNGAGYVAGNFTATGSLVVGTPAAGVAGEIRASNEITAYYSSDRRLKENIHVISNPISIVEQIRGVRFDWTDEHIQARGGEDGYFVRKQDIGVIAQEVEAVLPEIVATREDGTKVVKYEKLVALLIEAVKEQQKQINQISQALQNLAVK